MHIFNRFLLLTLALSTVGPSYGAATAPLAGKVLVMKNQFGEQSINTISSVGLPLASGHTVFSGATAPVDGTTGDNFAGKGSLYTARDTGALYTNTGIITNPTWTLVPAGSAGVTSSLLTGYVSGAGTVAASDTILQAFNKLNGNIGVYTEAAPSLTFDHAVGAKTITVRAVGKLVSISIPSAVIADGAAAVCASTTGLAAGYRPAAAVTFGVVVVNNGSTRTAGQLVVGSDGILTFSVLGAGFTNAAAAGWDALSVSYAIP